MRFFVFLSLLLAFSFSSKASDNPGCDNLFKFMCESPGALSLDERMNGLKQSIEAKLGNELSIELQSSSNYEKLLRDLDLPVISECQSKNIVVDVCKNKTQLFIKTELSEVHKYIVNKPSKFDDPNKDRPKKLLRRYENIAKEKALEVLRSSPKDVERMQKIFSIVQKSMIEKVRREVSSPQKEAMISRIQTIEFSADHCIQQEEARFFLNRSAYYQPSKHLFTVCPSMIVGASSDAQLAFAMGHELAHSIDPCIAAIDIGYAGKKHFEPVVDYNRKGKVSYEKRLDSFPYSELLNCLRNQKNAGSPLPAQPQQLAAITNQEVYDFVCDKDSIGETFADWMGSEMVPLVMQTLQDRSGGQIQSQYSKVLASKCKEFRRSSDMHLDLERRVNSIIAVQPLTRKLLGCKTNSSYGYCAAAVLKTSAKKDSATQKYQAPKTSLQPIFEEEGVK